MRCTALPIVDCHTHLDGDDLEGVEDLLAREREAGIDRICLLVTSFPGRPNGNPEAIYAKARHPREAYLFVGLDYAAVARDVDHRLTYSLAEQVDRMAALGADGIKMLNGKPDYRKASGIALDSVIYDDYFSRLEERGMPVLWHVNDPEEFWNTEEAPEWARGPGWLYDDTYPTKESLYSECGRVLERYPNLKVVLAHFYFLSDDLPRAAALLDRYPNVHFDLAPGIEMFHNFSKRPAEARDFFLAYQDRIVFGTDFMPGGLLSRIQVVRSFLETDDEFHVPTDDRLFWPDHRTIIKGIALPEKALAKVYAGNWARIVSPEPRPLDRALARAELNRLTALYDQLGAVRNRAREIAGRLAEMASG